MSLRICIPSKAILRAASYARSRASAGVAPIPVRLSTRPPAVTSAPPRAAGQAAGLARRQAELDQVGAQPRQYRLRLRVAEAGVELEHLRPLGTDHQAGVEDAAGGGPAGGARRGPGSVHRVDA